MNFDEIEQNLRAGLEKIIAEKRQLVAELEEKQRIEQRQIGAIQLLAELRNMENGESRNGNVSEDNYANTSRIPTTSADSNSDEPRPDRRFGPVAAG